MITKKQISLTGIYFITVAKLICAQTPKASHQTVEDIVIYHDSLFWRAFNSCNIEVIKSYVTQDLEFYHDKNGFTTEVETFLEKLKNGVCSDFDNFKIIRKAIPGTIKVYPLGDYGAIITGAHSFYISRNNTPSRLDGNAKFTHVWRVQDNNWKMSRVLSYDHKSPPQESNRKEMEIPPGILKQYEGSYTTKNMGPIVIKASENTLIIQAGALRLIVHPESKNLFFSKERPLTFEFKQESSQSLVKLIVREKNTIVEEAFRM